MKQEKNLIYGIKTESKKLNEKSDEELNNKINQIKKRAKIESLDKLIPEYFALVQEVSFRQIGLKHFETQLLAGIFLHQGNVVEMKTGEGKTLVSTLPVALNALSQKSVHVVTVNDYLAERDQKWMGKLYKSLGFTVGLVKSTTEMTERKKNYSSDITYITNSELVFDYLRDCSAYNLNEIVQKPFDFCLIDEIDSILIDESRTPFILSTFQGNQNKNKLYIAKTIATFLQKDLHFEIDEKRKEIYLSEKGYNETKKRLGKKSLYDIDDPWILEILNALKAKYIFKLNKDYVILNKKIVIVDEFTGRIMEDRRWGMGLHEAVEIKENVELGGGTKTKTSITYQNFFSLYPKLAGMTGTAKIVEKEFEDIYNLKVIVLPTVKPMIRKDLPDLVYQTELAKWKAVLAQSKKCFETGQPILIGTSSIEKSEFLSDLFKLSKIPHQVLNAKPENVTRESEIIAQAGERYAVTIATNMAGRGTDIILGGNPVFQVKKKMFELIFEFEKNRREEPGKEGRIIYNINKKSTDSDEQGFLMEKITEKYKLSSLKKEIKNLPYSLETSEKEFQELYEFLYKKIYPVWEKENNNVKNLGGLFVLGTERHETRRIDNQLRGRAGRQGDPGISQFFVSLEDDLIKIFGGESIKRWLNFLIQDGEKDLPLESDLLTKGLENAQKKVEAYNFDLRKNVFQYDEILNSQRKQLFQARNEMMWNNIYDELILRYNEFVLDEEFHNLGNLNSINSLNKFFDFYVNKALSKKSKTNYCDIWINKDLRFEQSNLYQNGFLKNNRSTFLLLILDLNWTEHIERMSYIRETINWRSYGQQNPLIEYNSEAFESLKLMFERIRLSMLYYFLNNPINY
jgi:preprotein translocase subunit SecA